MVQAWYMDNSTEDQREPHRTDDSVSLKALESLGVLYTKIDLSIKDENGKYPKLENLRKERNYSYEDTITCSPDKMENYEAKLKSFFEEHIHTDEEIRFIMEGSGYFDVRDKEDRWIRIQVVGGDLIILPPGIYHRFTLDTTNYIKANRLFVGEPVWTPHSRPADSMPARKDYLKKYVSPA